MLKILIATTALATLATAVEAAPRTRTQSFDGPRYAGARTVGRDWAAGSFARDASLTRKSDGAVASRSVDRQRTESGWSLDGTATGFRGNTRTWSRDVTRPAGGLRRR
jgi:hypothetical protein